MQESKQKAGGLTKTLEMTEREAKLGSVVALGPGKLIADKMEYVTPRLAVGDLVYMNIYAGNQIAIPDDCDFVILGAGCAQSSGTRVRYNAETKEAPAEPDGPDLMLNRKSKLQLQTEESIYMKVV